jgi:hypothetical protein
MRVGITGHIYLTAASTPLVYAGLVDALRRFPHVHGVTCLAGGTDQLFARAVRSTRGTYEVVLPARGRQVGPLLRHASRISYTRFEAPGPAAYAAASQEILRRCEHLLAVWDGDPRGGPGGTAQTVARARQMGLPVTVIWPGGAAREPAVSVGRPAPARTAPQGADSAG